MQNKGALFGQGLDTVEKIDLKKQQFSYGLNDDPSVYSLESLQKIKEEMGLSAAELKMNFAPPDTVEIKKKIYEHTFFVPTSNFSRKST